MSAQSTPATLIDGKAFSATLVDRVAAAVQRLETDHGLKPGLAVVIVGEDPASQIYVRKRVRRPCAPECAPTPTAWPKPPPRPICWL